MKLLISVVLSLFVATVAVAQDGYRVQPGDVLQIEVIQDPTLNREVLVLPDGTIGFPFAGTVRARGQTSSQIQAQISQGIAPNFAVSPDVFVTVTQLNEAALNAVPAGPPMIDVYFLGEVNAPGAAEVPRGSTLLQGLSLGGGFTNFAALRRIQLRRVNPHTGETSLVTLDYRGLSDGGVLTSDPVLADGDVILVPERRLFE